MNATLFKSIHFFVSVTICVIFAAWWKLGEFELGSRAGSEVSFNLWTGWIAFAFMALACLYVWRKYMHKLGYSRELKNRVDVAALERTDSRLNEIRRKVTKGFLTTEGEVKELAIRVIKEEGTSSVLKITVSRDDRDNIVLRASPPDRYGRMSRWLHAHLYYGLFSGVLVWMHGAGSLESPIGLIMNVLTLVVILTGVIGIFLFSVGPTWITRAEKTDVNFEDVFVLVSSLGEKIDELKEKFDDDSPLVEHVDRAREAPPGRVSTIIQRELDQVLATDDGKSNEAILKDMMTLIGQRGRMLQTLKRLMRIKLLINCWRVVHVPASIVLMAVVIGHIFSVWIY